MKVDMNNLCDMAAEKVMGWKLVVSGALPFWRTPRGDQKRRNWSPIGSASDQEEMLDTLRTYAVSRDDEGYYVTVYKDGEAYEGFHKYKRVAAVIAALKSNGMEVES